ncbi:hypothetical protein OG978_25040 [Streptomyces sp. NBC_01591]|uniref:hypothetical protein n=1 Tax=Streptomyces sp. NBC_01591 TaxID=2975888 RepID=UPI002DDC06EB|nr:hypothetical protein [Streptomyces sp. NBC_01591]WSD70355.1 hypothetical protein OG978_25040 [Streptomyces sp. NBC_01591]
MAGARATGGAPGARAAAAHQAARSSEALPDMRSIDPEPSEPRTRPSTFSDSGRAGLRSRRAIRPDNSGDRSSCSTAMASRRHSRMTVASSSWEPEPESEPEPEARCSYRAPGRR